MRAYLIDVGESGTELTGVTFSQVMKKTGGGGSLMFSIRDKALANYSTYKEYLWQRIEVRKNDGSTVIWEGFLTTMTVGYNTVIFTGVEALVVLNDILAGYNGLLSQGTCTSVGGDFIVDTNNSFVAADLETKLCLFTDDERPSREGHFGSEFAACVAFGGQSTVGDYTDLRYATDYFALATGVSCDDDDGIHLEFTFANHAAATQLVVEIECTVFERRYYSDAGGDPSSVHTPRLEIYNDDDTGWETADNANHTGIGRLPLATLQGTYTSTFFHTITVDDNIGEYFDAAGVVKVRITNGLPNANNPKPDTIKGLLKVHTAFMMLYYTGLFAAGDVTYTIDDVPEATKLTFTGQSPVDDNVAAGDTYRVGNYLHNIIPDLWTNGRVTFVSHDFDSTTLVDAADHTFDMIGDIIQRYAILMNRELWQQIGWVIQCKSTYTDSTINLTEADILVDDFQEGWFLIRDGSEMARDIFVHGDGLLVSDYTSREYPTVKSMVWMDARINSTGQANQVLTGLVSKYEVTNQLLHFDIDLDGGTYTNLHVGKTVDINLYSGVIDWTAALVKSLSYEQIAGGHLTVKAEVEKQ